MLAVPMSAERRSMRIMSSRMIFWMQARAAARAGQRCWGCAGIFRSARGAHQTWPRHLDSRERRGRHSAFWPLNLKPKFLPGLRWGDDQRRGSTLVSGRSTSTQLRIRGRPKSAEACICLVATYEEITVTDERTILRRAFVRRRALRRPVTDSRLGTARHRSSALRQKKAANSHSRYTARASVSELAVVSADPGLGARIGRSSSAPARQRTRLRPRALIDP